MRPGQDRSGFNRSAASVSAENLPPRHLIDEYVHKSQQVRCECGWTGSSASPDGQPSAWKRHVATFKGVKS